MGWPNIIIPLGKGVICTIRDKILSSSSAGARHKFEQHNLDISVYFCMNCGNKYSCPYDLRVHCKTSHPEDPNSFKKRQAFTERNAVTLKNTIRKADGKQKQG